MTDLFLDTKKQIERLGFNIIGHDFNRPWGGFYVISEDNAQVFSNIYFNGLNTEELKVSGKLSPKIFLTSLIV